MRTLAVAVLIGTCGPAFAELDLRTKAIASAQRAFELGLENRGRPLQARKHFAAAADRYHALHELGVRDPRLYLALGNAALLADRWPQALWAYHVGLKLDPNDAALRAHRDFVRRKVLLSPYGQGRNEPERWPGWRYQPTQDEFARMAGLAYTLAWLTGTLAFARRSLRLWGMGAVSGIAAIALGLGWWSACRQADIDHDTPLIILADNTPLYRGNGVNYPPHPDIALLPRGMEARQLHRRGGWLQVRLTSGETGWIPLDRALVVAP